MLTMVFVFHLLTNPSRQGNNWLTAIALFEPLIDMIILVVKKSISYSLHIHYTHEDIKFLFLSCFLNNRIITAIGE